MWGLAIELGIVGLVWAYHRWTDEKPGKPRPERELTLPRSDEAAPYPIIYGRCLVKSPVMVWAGTPILRQQNVSGTGGTYDGLISDLYHYDASMLFVIGIPFVNGTNRIYAVYVNEKQLNDYSSTHPTLLQPITDLTGDPAVDSNSGSPVSGQFTWIGTPTFESGSVGETDRHDLSNLWIEGSLEFLDGRLDQTLVDGGGAAATVIGQRMLDDGLSANEIPGYRGYMCAALTGENNGFFTLDHFTMGMTPNYPNFAFEVSSYPEGTGLGGARTVGQEANPADVLYDLLTSWRKLAIPFALVDVTSFTACAVTLRAEGHGYSRAIDDSKPAREWIKEILTQIDGVIYPDPTTGKLCLRLIRDDFDPDDLLEVNPSDGDLIEDVELIGSEATLVNKVRVVFNDRQNRYTDNSASAQDEANAVTQDNQLNESVIQMPGVCTLALAQIIADRELNFLCRPLRKCRATVSRAFGRVVTGDVVRVRWPEYGWSEVLFRVANVERGTLQNGAIRLWLIEDVSSKHRNGILTPGGVSFPGDGGIG